MGHPARPLPAERGPVTETVGELIVGPWKTPDPEPEAPAEPRECGLEDMRVIPAIDVVISSYAGNSREEAAAQVWTDWQRRYPHHHVRVHHPDEGWDPR